MVPNKVGTQDITVAPKAVGVPGMDIKQPANWAKRGFVIGWSSLCIAGMFLFMTALILLLPFAFVFSRLFE